MSMVTTLVSLSQFFRSMAIRVRNKAIKAIKERIAVVEAQQVEVEEHRSKLMIDCHNRYYAARKANNAEYQKALADLESRFTQKLNKIDSDFAESKRIIALTSQAASNELKRELAMLGAELDNLTK